MRLSQFIVENAEDIVQMWEDYARTLTPGKLMTVAELRDDAERMLHFIAKDIETTQSAQEQRDKSMGAGPSSPSGQETAAQDHGLARAVAYFSLGELVSEFRALRATVTRLWLERSAATPADALQLVRFNEAVDQLIAESVVRYAAKLEHDSALFTASIGHDLRNPLSAVVMWSGGLLRAPSLGERERSMVKSIEQSAQRITGMVDDLQSFTRTRLGSELTYSRAPTDLAQVCRAVIGELRAAHRRLDIRFFGSGDIIANVDRPRLAQVLSNLIGNAVQHGDKARPVTVHAMSDDDVIVIEVHNEGDPIPADHLRDLFQPLKTRPRAGTAGDGHLGLGLYIARRIVEGHGGTLTVSSADQTGTTFTLRIPNSKDADSSIGTAAT